MSELPPERRNFPFKKNASEPPSESFSKESPLNIIGGGYANFLAIRNTNAEFFLDFGIMMPDSEGRKVHSRILTTPVHAKKMMVALLRSLIQYEEQYGDIPTPELNQYLKKFVKHLKEDESET